jgi:hypothetical protein
MRCGLRSSRPGMRVDWVPILRPKAHIHHCSKRCANFQAGPPLAASTPARFFVLVQPERSLSDFRLTAHRDCDRKINRHWQVPLSRSVVGVTDRGSQADQCVGRDGGVHRPDSSRLRAGIRFVKHSSEHAQHTCPVFARVMVVALAPAPLGRAHNGLDLFSRSSIRRTALMRSKT